MVGSTECDIEPQTISIKNPNYYNYKPVQIKIVICFIDLKSYHTDFKTFIVCIFVPCNIFIM